MTAGQFILSCAVRCYQIVISPIKNVLAGSTGTCRFEPSCSHYALQAIRKHGSIRGSGLAIKRVCRCHPWGGAGVDPVP